ncbi:ABC transporter permease [Alicyclobacillus cycloheptanicus]|uniref:ABC transport system permease protein n=1 Tax=Alicyclobacillus cycloheptanicus TaxID=1457 RepID=A0ABT9XEK0_9BACL|nr:ABC transporter permease [Alicyclobacillus cycloheptanicus]MDQ0188721.1 putative ABC transport system permease protein [Alicyclobacillus cycloheptanicus]WDM00613.1 ABC transporter permease [Alicyclobacillus cycloheptanicus]
MNQAKTVKTAMKNLLGNPLRTILTLLGMMIGVASVVALMSIGSATTQSVTARIQGLGTNLLVITPGSTEENGISQGLGSADSLTMADVKALQSDSAIAAVAPDSTTRGQVVAGATNYQTTIEGSTPDLFTVRNLGLSAGRAFNLVEENHAADVGVIGQTTAENLFGNENPVGQTVWINGIAFQIIGELAEQGSTGATNNDDRIIIPLTTLEQQFTGSQNPSTIYAEAVSSKAMTLAQRQAELSLLQANGQVNFTITNQATLLSTLQGVNQSLQNLLGGIAGISLLVGGIGIMNIMLVSVTERTREIGLRKALGATRGAVLQQFLVESGLVGLLGGVIGILLGAFTAAVLGKIMQTPVQLNLSSVWISFVVSIFVGLVFGIYPAYRASRLSPINALRFE